MQQLAAGETWDDDGHTAFIHDHPPLLLTAQAGHTRFQVISVHMKARSNVDDDTADAERDREKRFLQAKSLASQVQALQQADPRMPLLVVGDFNAYQFTDGWTDVVNLVAGRYDDNQNLLKLGHNIVQPALWNAVNTVPPNDRYSFLYTQNFGEIQGYTRAGSGNPGRTSRLKTISQLEYERDYALPERLMYLAELRGMITQFQTRGAEQTRISNNLLFGVENGYKALKGRREALVDDAFFAQKIAEEKDLRAKVERLASPVVGEAVTAALASQVPGLWHAASVGPLLALVRSAPVAASVAETAGARA